LRLHAGGGIDRRRFCYLPRKPAEEEAVQQETEPPTIVIADDDPAHRLLTVKAFERSGLRHPIQQIEDGEELMEYLLGKGRHRADAAPHPMVILLDLNMPRKSGFEVLSEIKGHPGLRRIPVVVLTTSVEQRDVARCYDLGANSFISKPVDFGQFSETIRQLGDYWLNLVAVPPPARQAQRPAG